MVRINIIYGVDNFLGGRKMFWTGLIVGIFIGGNFGVLLMALFKADKTQ